VGVCNIADIRDDSLLRPIVINWAIGSPVHALTATRPRTTHLRRITTHSYQGDRNPHGARGGACAGSGSRASQGFDLTTIGIALGLVGAAAGARFLQGTLFGITPPDPKTFMAASLMFGLVATFASRVPAHRATKVDPMMPWEVSEVRSRALRSSGSFTIDHDEAAGNPSQVSSVMKQISSAINSAEACI
jgi:hypothetical protein